MGTLTISAAGFSNLPASAPASWPATVTWPGSQNPNGTKVYTVSDADWIKVVTWTAASQTSLQGTVTVPSTPTAAAILLAWLQIWIGGTITAVSQFFTVPAQPGTPPVIT